MESAAWTNSLNWSAAPYPASGDTATFSEAGNGNTVIGLDGLPSILKITFDTASAAAYTLGAGGANAQTLTLENSGILSVSNAVANSQTIEAAFVLGTTKASSTYILTNASPSCVLTLAGDITGAAAGGTAGTKTLILTGNGRTVLSGALSNGGATGITLNSYGTNTLAGNNTFSGNVTVVDGTLRLTHSNALGNGSKNASANNNVSDRNPSFVLDGSDGDLTIPSNVTFVTSNQRAGAVINEAGNNTILGNFTLTSGDGSTYIWSKGGKLTIAGNMTPNATDRQLYLRGNSDGEISGVIANGTTTAGLKVFKDVGAGTWTFSGANTYTGATAVSAGTLVIAGAGGTIASSPLVSVSSGATLRLENSASANHGDRLKDSGALSLTSGTLAFVNDGTAASFCETVGVVTVAGAVNTISNTQAAAGSSSALVLTSLTRSGSATVNFVGMGLGQSDRNRMFILGQGDGPIGNWATVNGASLAYYNSSQGVYAEGPREIAAQGDTVPNGVADVAITTLGTEGPDQLSDTVTAVGALTQNSPYASTLNTADKTLQASLLSIAAGMADLTFGVSPNDGRVAPASAGGELVLVNSSAAGSLKVNAVLANNGSPSSLTKFGAGDVVLAGTNTLSGAVAVNQGSLTLAESLALQSALLTTTGVVFDSSVTSGRFTLGNLTNSFSLPLADSAANPVSLTVGNNDSSSLFGGVISGPGSLTKTGSGTLALSGASSYSGGTTISEGALATGVAGGLGAGPVTNDATLNLTGGAVAYTALGTSLSGAGTINVTLGTGSGQTTLSGDYSGFTGLWNLGVGAAAGAGKAQMNGADNAAATVNVLTNATLYASQPATHSASAFLHGGDTGDSYGQLRLEGFAEWAGPVKLVNDVTGSGDGFFGAYSGTGTVSGVISDIGGAHPVSKVGGAVFIISGTNNTYAGQTWVRAGTLGAVKLSNAGQPGSLGQPALADSAIKIGNSGTGARLAYFGTGETSDRAIDLAGTTANAYLTQAGSGLLKFTSDITYSGAGGKSLILEGSTEGVGELSGVFTDGLPYTNKLIKAGTGKWVLSNVNTHSGETEIQNGTLSLTHPNAVASSSTLRFTSQNGVLSLDHSGSGETEMNLTIGVGNSGTLASGAGAGGVGVNHAFNDFSLSLVTVKVARAGSVLSGAPSISARTVNLSGGNPYTTTLYPYDADLSLGAVAILSGSFAKVLRLDGLSSGNTVTGAIYNGINTLSVYKANASTWTLAGSNTYSGATTVNGGTLVISGINAAIASNGLVTVSPGALLIVSNTPSVNHANRLYDTAPISLSGGTLSYAHTGGSADYSETVGAVTLASGASSTVAVSRADSARTSALTLTSLARGSGAAVSFTGDGLGVDTRNRILISNQPEGIIGFWASCNGASPALYSSALGVYASAFTDQEIEARGPTSTVPDNASANVRITAPGEAGPIALQGTAVDSVAMLQQCTTTMATVATANKTLRAHAVVINAGQEGLTLGVAEGDGTLTALADGGKLELVNDANSTLTINASISNNAGAVTLVKTGTGAVLLKGACTYSGDTAINAGSLTYASSATQALAGVISGAGDLVKTGTNILTLAGRNTFTGITYINEGVVLAQTNQAFGATSAGTVIASGATLDVGANRTANTLNLGSEPFTVSGAGVGGKGAIVNNSAISQYAALGQVTLVGDTTFGGAQSAGRFDIRNNTPTLNMNSFKLTKAGPNIFGLTSATVNPGTGCIEVVAGTVRFESNAKLNGSATNTLTVRGGATLELYQHYPQNACQWSLLCDDNATISAVLGGPALSNNWAGPITLGGTLKVTGSGNYHHALGGVISGPGSLVKYGTTTTYLTNDFNTYSGSTWIANGTIYVSSIRPIGAASSSLGAPTGVAAGTIRLGGDKATGTLVYTGAGDTTDRPIELAGNSGGAAITHAGTGLLKFTANAVVSGIGTNALTLSAPVGGAGEFAGGISNSALTRVPINKNGAGAWTLSGNNGYTGDVNIAAGTLILTATNAQGAGAITVGSGSGNTALNLTPTAVLTGSGGIRVGSVSGSQAAMTMPGGTVNRTPKTGDDLAFTLGRVSGSYGGFTMSAGDLTITRIQTGASSKGTNCVGVFRMTGGVATFKDYMLLARGTNTLSAFTLDGGTVFHTNAIQNISLGYEGGRAELNLTGGTLESYGRNLTVRQNTGNPTGIVNLCAGLLSVDLFQNTAPAVALLNFAGGTLKAGNVNSPVFIPASMSGVYTYGPFGTFAGGAVIDTLTRTNTVMAPIQAPSGNGVYSIALADQGSGYIGEPYVSIEGDGLGATAIANMSDDGSGNGTYRVSSVTVTCPGVNYTTSPSVRFLGGGSAVTAPTVSAVTLSANASGGLSKQGSGTLVLGAANTYTGATTVAAGTLKLGAAGALPTQTQVVLAGGTLDLNGYTVTNTFSGAGAIANGSVFTTLSPAGEGAIGTNSLALSACAATGSYLADVTASGACDLVAVQGNIDLSNLSLQIVNPDLLDKTRRYTLMTCSGTRTGTFRENNLPGSQWHLVYYSNGEVTLAFTEGTLIKLN